MITGTYLRDGKVTEVYFENGMSEIAPVTERELKVFTFEKKRRKPRRFIEGLSRANLVTFSIATGGTVAGLLIAIASLSLYPITRAMVIAVLVLDLIMLGENALRKE